jgi:hypothetical protein
MFLLLSKPLADALLRQGLNRDIDQSLDLLTVGNILEPENP